MVIESSGEHRRSILGTGLELFFSGKDASIIRSRVSDSLVESGRQLPIPPSDIGPRRPPCFKPQISRADRFFSTDFAFITTRYGQNRIICPRLYESLIVRWRPDCHLICTPAPERKAVRVFTLPLPAPCRTRLPTLNVSVLRPPSKYWETLQSRKTRSTASTLPRISRSMLLHIVPIRPETTTVHLISAQTRKLQVRTLSST